ncbi:MAG: DotG/IcmE/VirB10 family protein [Acetobacter sp.]|uniref:DotG/IcmE/VirB10 family protein n=1 Tax=Acetobacter sp. TaxID=440 RepID=UPI0039ED55C4
MSDEPQASRAQHLKSSFDGTRRLLPWVGGVVIIVVVGGYFFFGTTAHVPESAQITHPDMKSPAGGSNHSKTMDDLARKRDEQAAQAARKAGKSYTSALSGQDFPDPQDVAAEIGDTPDTTQKPVPSPPPAVPPATVTAPSPAAPAPSFTPSTPPPPSSHFNTAPAEKQAPPEQMSERAEMELIAAWSGGPRVGLEVPGSKGGSGGSGDSGFQTDATEPATFTQPLTATATTTRTDAELASQGTRSGKGTLLLPAGRGVYGHSILTVNSDLGNAVLMQIDSGPFRNARISGTFEMKSERLVIKFNRLMIGDADPIPVSGYAVSPQTAEVGVASEVREHLATRVILPAAAAFVEGLGSAMSNSNTTNYSNGSGMSSFTHLNLGEQMGAAAGTMGQQVGQIIQKQTPQQATVILKQNDSVGVIFDEPVYRS